VRKISLLGNKKGDTMLLPENPFKHLPHTFLLKPLLITGSAMEYYGLRQGNDFDFLVPPPEFARLCEALPEGQFTTVENEKGVRHGNYEFYVTVFGYTYYDLETGAIEERDYLVLHAEFLLFLKTLTLIRHPEDQKARQDILLLLKKLAVWTPPVAISPSQERGRPENVAALDATLEEVQEITVTRLTPHVRAILEQHGCRIEERGQENTCVIFPVNTRRQTLLPPTMIERSRILLSDGLELRQERDQVREMSLIAVVVQENKDS
jgi:hypothetical protein